MLTLDNFETVIDATILERGNAYYISGGVFELVDEGDGLWSAKVAGSYNYNVMIEITPEGVQTGCDCLYEWGPYCKHQAAALYAMREVDTDQPKQKVIHQPTRQSKLGKILNGLSKEELISIIMEQSQHNRTLYDQLMMRYSNDLSKSDYTKAVRHILNEHGDDYGFIDYLTAMDAAYEVGAIVDEARQAFAQGDYKRGVMIAQAVAEAGLPGLQNADDSSGTLSGAVQDALHAVDEVVKAKQLPDDVAESLFDYCLQHGSKQELRNYGFEVDWWWIAHLLVDDDDKQRRYFAAVDHMLLEMSDSSYLRYEAAAMVKMKIKVLERMDRPQSEILAVMEENVMLDRIRKMLIEHHIEAGDYARATALIQEGIKKAEADRLPGLVNEYREMVLKIAAETGDNSKIMELTEKLLLDSNRGMKYYNSLKEVVPADEWPTYVQRLIEKVRAAPNWRQERTLPTIYQREGMWEDLMQMAEARDINFAEEFKTDLHRHFPQRMANLYEAFLHDTLKNTSDRGFYKRATYYLRRIAELDSEERALALRDHFIEAYPRRRAMIDEMQQM